MNSRLAWAILVLRSYTSNLTAHVRALEQKEARISKRSEKAGHHFNSKEYEFGKF